MVNPAGGARHSRYLFDQLARQPGMSPTNSKQKTFQLQLQRSLASEEASVPVPSTPTAAGEGVSKRQAFADMARIRQEVVAGKTPKELAGPFGGTGAAIAPEKAAASLPAKVNAEVVEAKDPLSILREAMQKAGIPSNIDLTISDEMVQYPGGAYRNHQIKANFGNGVTESYNVDLMIRNPWLTALEMKRLMTGAA